MAKKYGKIWHGKHVVKRGWSELCDVHGVFRVRKSGCLFGGGGEIFRNWNIPNLQSHALKTKCWSQACSDTNLPHQNTFLASHSLGGLVIPRLTSTWVNFPSTLPPFGILSPKNVLFFWTCWKTFGIKKKNIFLGCLGWTNSGFFFKAENGPMPRT